MGRQRKEAVASYKQLKEAVPSGRRGGDRPGDRAHPEPLRKGADGHRQNRAGDDRGAVRRQCRAVREAPAGALRRSAEMTAFVEKNQLLGGEQLAKIPRRGARPAGRDAGPGAGDALRRVPRTAADHSGYRGVDGGRDGRRHAADGAENAGGIADPGGTASDAVPGRHRRDRGDPQGLAAQGADRTAAAGDRDDQGGDGDAARLAEGPSAGRDREAAGGDRQAEGAAGLPGGRHRARGPGGAAARRRDGAAGQRPAGCRT